MKTKLLTLAGIAILSCLFNSVFAQNTAGTLTFTFNQATPTAPAAPEAGNNGTPANIMAVWIENAAGTFIKTKYRFAGSQKDHLPTYLVKSGGTPPIGNAKGNCLQAACNITDAITGATRDSSTSPTAYGSKTVTWDGKNVVGAANGSVVADGVYKVWVESSWIDSGNNNHQFLDSFSFTKGSVINHVTPVNTTYLSNVVLHWEPVNLGVSDVASNNLEATIYPNPTNGIFNIDLENEVTSIKVTNLLGQLIKLQNVNTSDVKTSIDLSNNQNGIYIVTVSNNKGNTSNYKVLLSK